MTEDTRPKARIVITSTAAPARCRWCHQEVATGIMATTPGNPERHPIKVLTAYYLDHRGRPVCPQCHAEMEKERQTVWEMLSRKSKWEAG